VRAAARPGPRQATVEVVDAQAAEPALTVLRSLLAAGLPRRGALPPNLPPRGLCREAAAEYVGVGPTKFDAMVKDLRMPPPKRIDGRRVWDIRALDDAFAALPSDGDTNPWDEVLGG
jgi:hypothetical protein